MYTSQDAPSVSNKRVRHTLIIALTRDWQLKRANSRPGLTIALDAKVSAFHAK